jgi:LuxR family maltose regulon positive regulatory protein
MFRALTCRSGPDRMMADAELALSREPLWSPWRATAEGLTAEALLLRGGDGATQAASALFDDAIESAQRSGSPVASVAWLAERALVAMDLSDWAHARTTIATALSFIDEFHMEDDIVSTLAHAAAARCALHDGDHDRAERFAATAMRSRGIATYAVPFWAVRLRLVLARLHLARGEPVVARHLLEEIGALLRSRPSLGSLVGQTERLRELIDAAPFGEGSPPLSTAELRVLPYLQTHLTFDEMAERLHLSRNTVLSHSKAIYRKLGCSSRSAAVATAIALGLLGDFVANTTS